MTGSKDIKPARLITRVLQGALIFTIGTTCNAVVRGGTEFWSMGWRALTMGFLGVAVFGGLAGSSYFYLEPFRQRGGGWKIAANVGTIVLPAILALVLFFAWDYFESR